MKSPSLSEWVEYKKSKLSAFVDKGYSIAWHPDKTGWMHIYIPNKNYTGTPALSAYANFDLTKLREGINGGRIWELNILRPKRGINYRDPAWLYQYNLGRCAINRLENNDNAKTLFNSVLRLLN